LSNPDAAQELTRLIAAPRYFAFRVSRPALARPERRASESDGLGAEAARERPRGTALKPQRKLSQHIQPSPETVPRTAPYGGCFSSERAALAA